MSERSRSAISRSQSSSTTDRKREARWPRLRAAWEECYNSFPRERERRPGCRSDVSATWTQDVGDSHAARSAGHRYRHWTVWVSPGSLPKPLESAHAPARLPLPVHDGSGAGVGKCRRPHRLRESSGLSWWLTSDQWSRERMHTGQVFAAALRAGDVAAVRTQSRKPICMRTPMHKRPHREPRATAWPRSAEAPAPHERTRGSFSEFLRCRPLIPDIGTCEGAELAATAAVADAIRRRRISARDELRYLAGAPLP